MGSYNFLLPHIGQRRFHQGCRRRLFEPHLLYSTSKLQGQIPSYYEGPELLHRLRHRCGCVRRTGTPRLLRRPAGGVFHSYAHGAEGGHPKGCHRRLHRAAHRCACLCNGGNWRAVGYRRLEGAHHPPVWPSPHQPALQQLGEGPARRRFLRRVRPEKVNLARSQVKEKRSARNDRSSCRRTSELQPSLVACGAIEDIRVSGAGRTSSNAYISFFV